MLALENIKWLGHATFQIKKDKVIYIDPWKLKINEPADIILVTHQHHDHCSIQDINKILQKNTVVIAPPDCASELSGNAKPIKPGQRISVEGITVEAKPAYNQGKPFHPKANNWVGYVITVDNTTIYHAGDTDAILEMDGLKVDYALLPIGGTYTMDAQEAADCANRMQPNVAIPMHYDSPSDAQTFKKLCKVRTEILKVYNG